MKYIYDICTNIIHLFFFFLIENHILFLHTINVTFFNSVIDIDGIVVVILFKNKADKSPPNLGVVFFYNATKDIQCIEIIAITVTVTVTVTKR